MVTVTCIPQKIGSFPQCVIYVDYPAECARAAAGALAKGCRSAYGMQSKRMYFASSSPSACLLFFGSVHGSLIGQQCIEEEQAGSNNDGLIGEVKVGPVIGEDVNFKKIDDRGKANAVVIVADGATQD